jgi:hypothetical protein
MRKRFCLYLLFSAVVIHAMAAEPRYDFRVVIRSTSLEKFSVVAKNTS